MPQPTSEPSEPSEPTSQPDETADETPSEPRTTAPGPELSGSESPVESPAPEPAGTDPTPQEPLDGRARLKRAIVSPGRGQWVVAVLMALVGLAAVVVMRVNSQSDPYANMRQDALVNIMEGLYGTAERARREISALEATKQDLQQDATSEQAALDQAKERLSTLEVLAGRTAVSGPGIRVRIELDDTTNAFYPMIDLVQELRTAGAEAIAINGTVRVVAQTAFTSDAEGMVVDGQRIKAPWTVVAIGDSSKLSNAMTIRDGPKAQFEGERFAGTVDITELPRVRIDVVTQPDDDAGQNNQ